MTQIGTVSSTIIVSAPVVSVITGGTQGPEGKQGPVGPAGATTVIGTAAIALSGDRLVTYDADAELVYASCDRPDSVFGLSLNASSAGEQVNVQTSGKISELSWTWIPLGPLYLGLNGFLTQTPPAAGYCVRCGWAIDAHTIMLAIEPALKLA